MISKKLNLIAAAVALTMFWATEGLALPVLQLFIEDAVYESKTDNPDDPETWAKVGTGSFRLWVLGDTSGGPINDVKFVASFADGLTPSLTFTSTRENNAHGFIDFTTPIDVTGPSAVFDADTLAKPNGPFPNHNILKTGRSAIEFGLGDFTETTTRLANVQPSGGMSVFTGGFPDPLNQFGQINVYEVLVAGLAVGQQVHFDAYGTRDKFNPQGKLTGTEEVFAPLSHDARWQQAQEIPEPRGALLLIGGLLGLAAMRFRARDKGVPITA